MKTLALVFGGESCEHDISVITALSVYNAIKNRFQVYPVYLKEGLFWTGEALKDVSFYAKFDIKKLKETTFRPGLMAVKKRFGYAHYKIDCVLVCNHGGVGENGSLSGYFETVGIPYTSSDPVGSGICMDKVLTKYFLEKFRFPVVNYRVYRKGGKVSKVEELGYPVILKPARLGSSVGISYVRNREELEKGLAFSTQFDEKVLCERALENFEEYNCAVCSTKDGVVISEVEHPVFKSEFMDFYDKYEGSDGSQREIPAKIDGKLRERIRRTSKEIYLLLELKGPVRIDYLYENGKLYVNEINSVPGSLACYLFKSEGLEIADVAENAVESAIAEFERKRGLLCDFASDVLKNYAEKGAKKLLPLKK